VIVQANSILEYLDKSGDCIESPVAYSLIKGEAYAIRAFCHLDILRLFGQVPQNPSKRVKLPYAEVVSIKDFPSYYDYAAFCQKLEDDLLAAEKAMVGVDPVFSRSLTAGGH
jgi:hypothetical protein